ncbi:carboxymuconolactone decarboxylase family protein [Nocardia sp. BMG51109]|uniref:carboxymuconolactone decarboxylase family protein n=1 Tax=Nocardia sp. BMG51109 TaxID=1056816 RepID=UPI00046614F4|nr:carboxymuconolactone decarboxylase family protein [Nocardia sp. BMG51109]
MARIPYRTRDTWPPDLDGMKPMLPPLRIFDMLAHAGATTHRLFHYGAALFEASAIEPRLRQLVILAVARANSCEYVWRQHEVVSLACGVSEAQQRAVQRGDFTDPGLDARDSAVLTFTTAVVTAPRAGDAAFAAIQEHFDHRQIVELIQLIGYYWNSTRIATTLDLEPEQSQGTRILDATAGVYQSTRPAGTVNSHRPAEDPATGSPLS